MAASICGAGADRFLRWHSQSRSLLLARALLWAAMSPEMDGGMDEVQRHRIQEEYLKINTLPDGVNPIVRVGLRISRRLDLLVIEEVLPEVVPGDPAAARAVGVAPLQGVGSGGLGAADVKMILDTMFSYQQQNMKLHESSRRSYETMMGNLRKDFDCKLATLNQNLCR